MQQRPHALFRFFFSFLVCLVPVGNYCFAQADSLLKRIQCDCDSAIRIDISRKTTYGFTEAPKDFGKLMEIKANSSTLKTAFEQEHHSAWYLLEINISGEMIFEITPIDKKKDDYDFLLFPYEDSLTCINILNKKIKAIRGNLSRNDTDNLGVTGLSGNVANEFSGKGVGAQFSKSVDVKKGEKYILVLDNVYANGKGHKINFAFVKEVNIGGHVVNDVGKPLVAEVTLYDNKGKEVKKTTSDTNGDYRIKASIVENVNYSIAFIAPKSFVASETINTKSLKDSSSFINIKAVLPKLKKGNRYKVGNLNFYGNSSQLIPRSFASLVSLYQLMKKNKSLKIRIEGHVNAIGIIDIDHFWQQLSEERAKAVYTYLLNRGIEENRMSIIGFSNKFMLFEKPKNEYEQEANRRVEIKVLSINED